MKREVFNDPDKLTIAINGKSIDPTIADEWTDLDILTGIRCIEITENRNLNDKKVTLRSIFRALTTAWFRKELHSFPFPIRCLTDHSFKIINGWDLAGIFRDIAMSGWSYDKSSRAYNTDKYFIGIEIVGDIDFCQVKYRFGKAGFWTRAPHEKHFIIDVDPIEAKQDLHFLLTRRGEGQLDKFTLYGDQSRGPNNYIVPLKATSGKKIKVPKPKEIMGLVDDWQEHGSQIITADELVLEFKKIWERASKESETMNEDHTSHLFYRMTKGKK